MTATPVSFGAEVLTYGTAEEILVTAPGDDRVWVRLAPHAVVDARPWVKFEGSIAGQFIPGDLLAIEGERMVRHGEETVLASRILLMATEPADTHELARIVAAGFDPTKPIGVLRSPGRVEDVEWAPIREASYSPLMGREGLTSAEMRKLERPSWWRRLKARLRARETFARSLDEAEAILNARDAEPSVSWWRRLRSWWIDEFSLGDR